MPLSNYGSIIEKSWDTRTYKISGSFKYYALDYFPGGLPTSYFGELVYPTIAVGGISAARSGSYFCTVGGDFSNPIQVKHERTLYDEVNRIAEYELYIKVPLRSIYIAEGITPFWTDWIKIAELREENSCVNYTSRDSGSIDYEISFTVNIDLYGNLGQITVGGDYRYFPQLARHNGSWDLQADTRLTLTPKVTLTSGYIKLNGNITNFNTFLDSDINISTITINGYVLEYNAWPQSTWEYVPDPAPIINNMLTMHFNVCPLVNRNTDYTVTGVIEEPGIFKRRITNLYYVNVIAYPHTVNPVLSEKYMFTEHTRSEAIIGEDKDYPWEDDTEPNEEWSETAIYKNIREGGYTSNGGYSITEYPQFEFSTYYDYVKGFGNYSYKELYDYNEYKTHYREIFPTWDTDHYEEKTSFGEPLYPDWLPMPKHFSVDGILQYYSTGEPIWQYSSRDEMELNEGAYGDTSLYITGSKLEAGEVVRLSFPGTGTEFYTVLIFKDISGWTKTNANSNIDGEYLTLETATGEGSIELTASQGLALEKRCNGARYAKFRWIANVANAEIALTISGNTWNLTGGDANTENVSLIDLCNPDSSVNTEVEILEERLTPQDDITLSPTWDCDLGNDPFKMFELPSQITGNVRFDLIGNVVVTNSNCSFGIYQSDNDSLDENTIEDAEGIADWYGGSVSNYNFTEFYTINLDAGRYIYILPDYHTAGASVSIHTIKWSKAETIITGAMQSILPYEQPFTGELHQGVFTHGGDSIQWNYPKGWGVGRVTDIKVTGKTDNTTYKLGTFKLYKKSIAEGGFVKVIIFPYQSCFNNTRDVNDPAWVFAGHKKIWNDGKTDYHYNYYYGIQQGLIIVDGAVAGEIIAGIVEDSPKLYNINPLPPAKARSIFTFGKNKIYYTNASTGDPIDFADYELNKTWIYPLDDYSEPTDHDVKGMELEGLLEEADVSNELLSTNLDVQYLDAGIYDLGTETNIDLNLTVKYRNLYNPTYLFTGNQISDFLNKVMYAGRGCAYGLAEPNQKIKIYTPESVTGHVTDTTVTANSLGFWISPPLNTKGRLQTNDGAEYLRNRKLTRVSGLLSTGEPTGEAIILCGFEHPFDTTHFIFYTNEGIKLKRKSETITVNSTGEYPSALLFAGTGNIRVDYKGGYAVSSNTGTSFTNTVLANNNIVSTLPMKFADKVWKINITDSDGVKTTDIDGNQFDTSINTEKQPVSITDTEDGKIRVFYMDGNALKTYLPKINNKALYGFGWSADDIQTVKSGADFSYPSVVFDKLTNVYHAIAWKNNSFQYISFKIGSSVEIIEEVDAGTKRLSGDTIGSIEEQKPALILSQSGDLYLYWYDDGIKSCKMKGLDNGS